MRLTDDKLRASDEATMDLIGKALILAAPERMGLLPGKKPFDVAVSVASGMVEVESIYCLAVTCDGSLIDVDYDTRYTSTHAMRTKMPDDPDAREWKLIVYPISGQWHDVDGGYEEPDYGIALIAPDSYIPADALPIARLIKDNNGSWRTDAEEFVPPCLYIASHKKYKDLWQDFRDELKKADQNLPNLIGSVGEQVARTFWPVARQLMIAVDRGRDQMTPMALLGYVQQYVGVFACACQVNGYGSNENYGNFMVAPYTYRDAYPRIVEGIGLCCLILESLKTLAQQKPEEPKPEPRQRPRPRPRPQQEPTMALEPPTIDESETHIECNRSTTTVKLATCQSGVKVKFMVSGTEGPDDGQEKQASSMMLSFNNGFGKKNGTEYDKTVELYLWTEANGKKSSVNTYLLTLSKSLNYRDVIRIP